MMNIDAMMMIVLVIIIVNYHHLDRLQVVRGEERREEVECPVCTEEMIPPKRIFQVSFLCLFALFAFVFLSELFFLVCSDRDSFVLFCRFVCLAKIVINILS